MTAPFCDYDRHDAVGLAGLVADGSVHPSELVEAAIERIESANPAINAVVDRQYDAARRRAASAIGSGAFAGVPILIKDLMTVEGERVTFGSVFFREYVAEETPEFMHRILRAGFIPVGRTNTPEFGLLPTTEPVLHGPTRNPWDTARSAGGSSGGAAAAVAAGMVPLAQGSDGGGSIRIPASACGVFGLKPTRGRIPQSPPSPADYLSVSLGLSRSVRDSAALLDAVSGAESGAEYWAPQPDAPFVSAADRDHEPASVAFSTRDFRGNNVAPECVEAVVATAQLLEDLGHRVVEVAPPIDGIAMAEAFIEVWASLAAFVFELVLEGAAAQARVVRWLRRVVGDWWTMRLIAALDARKSGKPAFEPFTWGLARMSRRRSQAHLGSARLVLQETAHRMGRFLEAYDFVLSPVLGAPPPAIGEIDQDADWDALIDQLISYVAFTPLANFSGLPAMSVPVHWTADGLPIGSHFTGRFGDDFGLLQLAGQLERARPWRDRRPSEE